MLLSSVQSQSARLRGAAAARNGRGFPLTPLPRASVLRCSSADPPDAAQQQPPKAAPKPQRTGLVSIAGDLLLHIDTINVHLTGSSPPQAGQQELETAVKSAVMDTVPSTVAAHLATLATPTEQPAPLAPPAPLVPPFTRICELKISDVRALAMCSDGHHFVCGHKSGEVALRDVRKPGQKLVAELGNSKRVQSVAVSADCGRVLVGCEDGLWLWDVGRGRTAGLMKYDSDDEADDEGWQRYLDVAITPDGSYGVSGEWDELEGLRVWDLEREECIGRPDTMGGVVGVSISSTGDTATALVKAKPDSEGKGGGGGLGLQVWKRHAGSGMSAPVELQGKILSTVLGLSADGDVVLAADRITPAVHRFDVRSGKIDFTLKPELEVVCRLALSCDGRRAVLGTREGNLLVLDVEGKACLATLPAHVYGPRRFGDIGYAVKRLAISSDGRHAVSYSEDAGRLCVWHLG